MFPYGFQSEIQSSTDLDQNKLTSTTGLKTHHMMICAVQHDEQTDE